MRSRINASDLRSAAVTKSASPLYSILMFWSKYSISKEPASRAMTLMAGRNEECSVVGVKIQFRRSAQVKAKGQRFNLKECQGLAKFAKMKRTSAGKDLTTGSTEFHGGDPKYG